MALRRVVQAAFLAFIACVAAIAHRARLEPAAAPARPVTASELARHATASDCWLAVHGGVYDVTRYLPEHPAPLTTLTDWCGREASAAFDTKGRGRPHSPRAAALLEDLRVGTFIASP